MVSVSRFTAAAVCALAIGALPAAGQMIPPLFGGRVTIGGDVDVTFGGHDGRWFNVTDYYTGNTFRLARVGTQVGVRTGDRVSFFGELRAERDLESGGRGRVRLYALMARIVPIPSRDFQVQIGRIPPVFGVFARRAYSFANPLIGTPLGYQYFSTLRQDELPSGPADFMRQRGRGYATQLLGGGASTRQHGLPAIAGRRWDTGIEVHTSAGPIDLMGAVTNGTLSAPEIRDHNGGRQVSGRIGVRPLFALSFGVSAARGPYLDRIVEPWLPPGRKLDDYLQRTYGLDGEFAAGHFLTRGEIIWSRWDVPRFTDALGLTSLMLEGQYKLMPGLYVAARGDVLRFARIPTANGLQHWDYPVRRLEFGGGYYPERRMLIKGVYQINRRDGTRFNRDNLAAMQIGVRF